MKKYFVVFLLVIVLCPFMKVKADIGSICDYEGYISNYKSLNSKGTIKVFIEKDHYSMFMDSIYILDIVAGAYFEWTDIFNGATQMPVHLYQFNFVPSLKNATRVGVTSDPSYDVTWSDGSEKTDFRDKGYCPSVITIQSKSGLAISGDGDYELIMSEAQSPSADDGTYLGNLKAENFYLKASLFSEEQMATVAMYSTTCISDVDTINLLTSYYDFSHPNMDSATNSEKEFLADLYEHNGMMAAAEAFIETYGPGSECYENNPSAQAAYDALTNACDEFLYKYGGGEDSKKVDECDEIIGSGTFAYYLNQAFRFIQYLGPVLVIIYSTIEYIKVAATSDADLLKKTNKRTITRIIFALLLFFIPMIIKVILNIVGFYGNCLDTIL